MSPFLARVSSVVHTQDTDFGRVLAVPNDVGSKLPRQEIDECSSLLHLPYDQKSELLQALDKYPECFSKKTGL
jgi:hypothetical protein